MINEFAGSLLAFKGDDEYIAKTNVLLEVTDVSDGAVEIAFNAPLPGSPRIYINIPLAELFARVIKGSPES